MYFVLAFKDDSRITIGLHFTHLGKELKDIFLAGVENLKKLEGGEAIERLPDVPSKVTQEWSRYHKLITIMIVKKNDHNINAQSHGKRSARTKVKEPHSLGNRRAYCFAAAASLPAGLMPLFAISSSSFIMGIPLIYSITRTFLQYHNQASLSFQILIPKETNAVKHT